jgi:transcriptional antiterminator
MISHIISYTENAKAHHVRKTEMDKTMPDTFRVKTTKVITESPKNDVNTIRKIADESISTVPYYKGTSKGLLHP